MTIIKITSNELKFYLFPPVSVGISVVSSVVTSPSIVSVGMAVVTIIPGFGASFSLSFTLLDTLQFRSKRGTGINVFSTSLPPVSVGITVITSIVASVAVVSVGMAIVTIIPRFGAGLSLRVSCSRRGGSRLLVLGFSLPPVSVRISVVSSVVSSPSVVSVGMTVVTVVPAFGAGLSFSLRCGLGFGVSQCNKQG